MDAKPDDRKSSDGVVQLRFADEDGHVRDINAAELAEALQGLVEFTSQLAKKGALGEGVPPTVRVRPPKEGSFIVETILQYPVESLTYATSATGALVQGLNVAVRRLRGQVVDDFEPLPNGNVKLKWRGGGVTEVPQAVWQELNTIKRPTRRAMRKLLAPLSDDVETLEIRQAQPGESTEDVLKSAPAIVAVVSDYKTAAVEPDEEEESVDTFEAEATFESLDFRPGEKWRVQTRFGKRAATIEDDAFLLDLDRGMAIHKDDLFIVKIRENRVTKNGRVSTSWALVEVRRTRRGVDDGHDENASDASSAADEA